MAKYKMPKYYDMLVAIKGCTHDSGYKNFMIYGHDPETQERTLLAKYDLLVIEEGKVQIDTKDFNEFRIYPRDSFKKITCDSMGKITLAFKDTQKMSKTFNILVEETLSRYVEVEAETDDEAVAKVRDMYSNQQIVLTGDDFSEVTIKEENRE